MEMGNRVKITQKGHAWYNLTGVIVGKRGLRAPGDPMYLLMLEEQRRVCIVPESMLTLNENDDADKSPTRLLFRTK